MKHKKIHPSFKWEGKHLNKSELIQLSEEYLQSEEEYLLNIGEFLKAWFDDNEWIEVQTSGSTGTPKKIWVKKEHMYNSAKATEDFFDLGPNTKALLCLPATYIAGKLMIVRALVLGWELDIIKPQANPLIRKKKYDFTAFTPYQLKHSLENLDLVKKIMVGGGAVSQSLKFEIQSKSTEIFETYAMTETLTHIAARKINHNNHNENPPFELLKDVKIDQDQNACLIISAPKVSDEIIYTNDLVEIISPSKFHLLGRLDNIINSGGIKLIPEKIEKQLSSIIEKRFFVIGEPDSDLGERLVLLIESPLTDLEIIDLDKKIKNLTSLKNYERPKRIYGLSKFMETHSGKVKRSLTYQLIKNRKSDLNNPKCINRKSDQDAKKQENIDDQ